jgi:hypothetical protein
MFGDWISVALENFALTMFCVAVVFILFHRLIRRQLSEAEIVYRWMALFALGFTGIYTFIFHAFYPETTAAAIGWASSPFQYEVAMADLAFGVLGILSFNASYGFRLATVIGATCWLWGDAANHLYQMIKMHNYTVGNAGSWFWMDILVPLILIICLIKLRQTRPSIFR